MDEYGETPTIYVWLKGHEDGTALPEDFWERLDAALATGGFERECV